MYYCYGSEAAPNPGSHQGPTCHGGDSTDDAQSPGYTTRTQTIAGKVNIRSQVGEDYCECAVDARIAEDKLQRIAVNLPQKTTDGYGQRERCEAH
jgi:hypothetical protein